MRSQLLLQQAARLRALLAIGRARLQARAASIPIHQSNLETSTVQSKTNYIEPEPDQQARTLAAELIQRVAIDESGAAFDENDSSTWGEADAAIPEIVSLGNTRFRIVDEDATDLAVAAGAIAPGDTVLCLRVEFDAADAAMPDLGQVVVVATEEPGVKLMFGCWMTYDALHDPSAPDLGPDAERNPAFDVLEPGQALLVQVLDAEEAP